MSLNSLELSFRHFRQNMENQLCSIKRWLKWCPYDQITHIYSWFSFNKIFCDSARFVWRIFFVLCRIVNSIYYNILVKCYFENSRRHFMLLMYQSIPHQLIGPLIIWLTCAAISVTESGGNRIQWTLLWDQSAVVKSKLVSGVLHSHISVSRNLCI